ncbi:glycoside hydrolase family 3 N-terminal domain-containing protein [uncultured Veillonella sp.]|uniref:glycoside hydrolase family 3 N-terminal domain-containing protein n=1 Tax=uncultured Veillonella sp. TaxID=159268 RepID=UPI0028D40174|nr:glycoside hydrolase family 3 N-terminal domain-containing protein [uncultured Veillonella sp.]
MNLLFWRVLCGIALVVAVIGAAGCQHESQAEQEEVRTISYRAVMQSDKPVPEKVNTWLGAMSQEDKIGQLMMISLHGNTVGQSQRDVIRKYRVSGVMLTNGNLHNKDQVKAFTKDIMQTATTASMITPYIGINRDKVLRSNESFLRLPEPNRWGQLPMERIVNLVTRSAIEMRDMGFNLIMGPNANLGVPNVSYTSDPTWAGHMDLAMAERYQINQIWFGYNYFPTVSLGDASFGTANEAKAYLNNTDVAVFKRLISQTTANTYMLIMSHVQIPAIDNTHLASTSKAIITDWLRHDLGYNGVVMTDRIDIGALQANQKIGDFAVSSIVAGSDLVLVDADTVHIDEVHRALTQAVANGTITNDRLNDAVKHILLMKMQTQIQQ